MSDESIFQQEKEARAERLKRVRLLAGLSRKEMGEGELAIHSDTYKGWETARFGGLTDKGAQKVVEKLRVYGVSCSVNWLLYGIGVPPFQDHSIKASSDNLINNSTSSSVFGCNKVDQIDQIFGDSAGRISKELAAFKAQENSIDFCITDDSMSPWYLPGDIVAGVKILAMIRDGVDCIIQLPSGELLLRKVHHGKGEGAYNLLTHKPDGPLLTEVPLSFIAPVIWWRRPLSAFVKRS